MAILLGIAALLFPVFQSTKVSAQRAACISNFHQGYFATSLYTQDYDETFMLVNHQPATEPNSRNDRTWVQLLLPYTPSFSIFHCPSDASERPQNEATFDQDLVPGDTFSQYYTASLRSNLGFNYLYLSPIVKDSDGKWKADPRTTGDIAELGNTLIFVDSVWARTLSGKPHGGGNWLVVPPCRYKMENGEVSDSFQFGSKNYLQYFSITRGWTAEQDDSSMVYGGAWPWHEGRITVVHADGSVKMRRIEELTAGCDAHASWNGLILDTHRYPWDIE